MALAVEHERGKAFMSSAEKAHPRRAEREDGSS